MTKKTETEKYEPPKTKDGKVPPRSYLVAHFLNWAAEKRPTTHFQYNEIAKEIGKLARLPARESMDAKSVASVMSRAKEILLNQFGRGAMTDRELGHRACVSSEEVVLNDLKPRLNRKLKAERRIQAICEKGIDMSTLTKPNASLVRRVKQIVQPEVLQEAIDQNNKLLGI